MENKMLEEFFEKYTKKLREINANRSSIDFSKEYYIDLDIDQDQLEDFRAYMESRPGRRLEDLDGDRIRVVIESRENS